MKLNRLLRYLDLPNLIFPSSLHGNRAGSAALQSSLTDPGYRRGGGWTFHLLICPTVCACLCHPAVSLPDLFSTLLSACSFPHSACSWYKCQERVSSFCLWDNNGMTQRPQQIPPSEGLILTAGAAKGCCMQDWGSWGWHSVSIQTHFSYLEHGLSSPDSVFLFMTTTLSGSLGSDLANLTHFLCKSFQGSNAFFFWDLASLCAYIPDALHLNECRSRKQTYCRKIWQRIKLEYMALKQGIRYESERQWEGFWQINKATDMSLKENEKDFEKYLWNKALSLHSSCIWDISCH